ncbi:MAG: N-acetylneuraminate synthase family protein [Patescibacteria group bacterium]
MPYIIAELCQNHSGERKIFGEMIRAAAEAGATHLKMQTIFSEDLTRRERFEDGWVENNGVQKTIRRPFEPERDRLRRLDLTLEDHFFFIEECKKAGVIPLTAIFARRRIPAVAALPWSKRVVKVASYDCASHAMIRELSGAFDHLIVSTGGTFDDEIRETARIVKDAGRELTLLHCVTSYPNTRVMCNLARIGWLRQFAPTVGWSDHTLVARDGIQAAKVALAEGADYVERHFTIQETDKTKDGPISVTPALLKELTAFAGLPRTEMRERIEREIPDWRIMIGTAGRDMTQTEMLNRDYYRGRFASWSDGRWVYNWEEEPVKA